MVKGESSSAKLEMLISCKGRNISQRNKLNKRGPSIDAGGILHTALVYTNYIC